MESSKKVPFTRTSYHLSFKYFFVKLKIHFFCQRAYVTNIYAIFVKNILDAWAVNKKYRRIVKHLCKSQHMVFFYSFTCICQLKFTFRVRFFTYFAKYYIGERSLGTNDHFRPEVPYWFNNVAVNKKWPKLGYTH